MADNTAPDFQYNMLVTPENSRPPLSYGVGGRSPGPPSVLRSTIVDFWKSKGVKDHVAEGIADALYTESGIRGTTLYNPLAVNPRSGATGLAQDLGSRKTELQSQPDWTEPQVQLENMYREVTGGDKIASAHWNEIKNAPDKAAVKELWRQHFERSEGTQTARGSAPGWVPSDGAIESEQNKSNTDVKYITPEEFLAMLPPIKWDDSARAKRKNLQDSLASGDNIEAIPSLEVTPRGDNLVVADWDGRNRAQAAIDAGVDEIPVAIRGVPPGSEFKLLVGNKKVSLPYTFADVPRPAKPAPLVGAAEQARQIVPEAFAPPPRPPLVPPAQPGMVPPAPAPPLVPPPAKPDFYPEIAAGINKDVVNPAGYGYRGVGIPDLATNATASGRIAAANAGSAGQIGLGGAIGSALSALNPIGSAQAAEPTALPSTAPVFEPIPDRGRASAPSTAPVFEEIKPAYSPAGYVPSPPGLDTVAPPLANALFSPATALAGDIIGGAQQPGSMIGFGRAGQLAGGQMLPGATDAAAAAASAAQARMQIPETPVGQAISNIIQSPGALLGWAISEILGPEQTAALAQPGVKFGLDAIPGVGLANRGVANALAAPARSVLSRVVRSPEMRAAAAVNRHQAAELRKGGVPAPEVANQLARAGQLGIPAAPLDFLVEGGPQERFLRHAVEHSPEAEAAARQFATERTQGIPTGPLTPPTGGTLERSGRAAEQAFGPGSAYQLEKDANSNLDVAKSARADEGRALTETQAKIAAREAQLNRLGAASNVATDPKLIGLRTDEGRSKAALRLLDRTIRDNQANKAGLKLGKKILQKSTGVEEVRDFLSSASPAAKAHLQTAVKDALHLEYENSALGGEPFKVENKVANKAKVVAAFDGDVGRATDLMDSIRIEAAVSASSKNALAAMKRDRGFWYRRGAQALLAMEAGLHLGAALSGVGHAGYWGIRGARYGANMLLGGGGVAARTKGQEIARLYTDPNAAMSATGLGPPRMFGRPGRPELFAMPARPTAGPASQANINSLSRAMIPLGYGALVPRPDAPEAQ